MDVKSTPAKVNKVLDKIMKDTKTKVGGNVFHIKYSTPDGAKHERRRVWPCGARDANLAILHLASEKDVDWSAVNWAIASLIDGKFEVLDRKNPSMVTPWIKTDFNWSDFNRADKPHIKLTSATTSTAHIENELAKELAKLDDIKELPPLSPLKKDLLTATKYPRYVK